MSEQFPSVPGPAVPRPQVSLAISWAFDTFKKNPLPFIALAAVVAVIQVIQEIGAQPLSAIVADCSDPQTQGQINACAAAVGFTAIAGIVVTFVFLVLAFLATIGVYRAALDASRGITPEFTVLLKTANLGRYVVFSLAYLGLVILGFILCVIPGILVAFFLQLGPFFVLDRGYRPVEAMKASYSVISKNVGPAIVMVIFSLIVTLLGSAFYGILTLVTLPFAALFIVHMYRQFNGETVA
ncbi:MAG: hypothetical protein ACOYO9_01315 [Candidatus Nanopelagicales bacterium]|jgi:uncharacterized membrane protein